MSKLTVKELKELMGIDEKLEIAFGYITPDIAEKIINCNNDKNRDITNSYAKSFKNKFARGEYHLDTECLGFNSEGTLTDGQHRLLAMSMQEDRDMVFKIGVMFDVEHQMDMNTGKKRSLQDNAKLFLNSFEVDDEDTLKKCLAVLKDIITFSKGRYDFPSGFSQKQYKDVFLFLKDKMLECYNAGLFRSKPGRYPTSVQSALFIAYCDGVDIEILKYVSDKLIGNSSSFNGTTDNPIWGLAKKLEGITGGGREPGTKRHLYTQDCIYKMAKGSTSSSLSCTTYRYKIDERLPHRG